MTRRGMAFALVAVMLSAVAAAQAYAPIVTMGVTMPDGRTQELTGVSRDRRTAQGWTITDCGLVHGGSGSRDARPRSSTAVQETLYKSR